MSIIAQWHALLLFIMGIIVVLSSLVASANDRILLNVNQRNEAVIQQQQEFVLRLQKAMESSNKVLEQPASASPQYSLPERKQNAPVRQPTH